MISFAFPEKELGEGCSVRYKLWLNVLLVSSKAVVDTEQTG